MNNKSKIFIGARALEKKEVNMILPTYQTIINQINDIRDYAKNNKDDATVKQFNNNFAILGKRGSGKSSIIKTIIKEIESQNNQDLILPVIEPDLYSDSTKIMGSILGILKTEISQIENEIKKNENIMKNHEYFRNCRYIENNPLSSKMNEVIEYYCYINPEYRELLTKNYTDMSTFRKKYSFLLSPDYEFNIRFKNFIDEIISIKKKISGNREPLIFIIIDDIDLKTNKTKDLIDSVLQYMNHKNIVCILSADYEILNESITLALLEKESLINSIINSDEFNKEVFGNSFNITKRKKYLSNEYLKKILPPSLRHNVVLWNENNIPTFSFMAKDCNEEFEIILHKRIRKLLGNYTIFTNGEQIISYGYSIFDKSPRGLINVLYYLEGVEDFKKSTDTLEQFNFIKGFVDTLISSSTELNNYKKEIYDNYLQWGKDQESTVLKYKNIEFKCNTSEDLNSPENYKNKSVFILLYILSLLFNKKDSIDKESISQYEINICKNDLNINEEDYLSIILKEIKSINFEFLISFITKLRNEPPILSRELKKKAAEEKVVFKILVLLFKENVDTELILKNIWNNKSAFPEIVNLLYSRSIITENYNKTEKIANDLITYRNTNLKDYKEKRYFNVLENLIKVTIRKNIFENDVDHSYINKRMMKKIFKVNQNNENISNELFIKIKEKYIDLNKIEIEKVDSSNISVYLNNTHEKIKEFLTGEDGQSYTKYKALKEYIEEQDLYGYNDIISLEEFSDILEKLEDLFLSSSWYGVKESRELYSYLINTSYFDNKEFINNNINEYYLFLDKYSDEFNNINNNKEEKIYIKELLSNTFDKALNEEKSFHDIFYGNDSSINSTFDMI